MTGSEGLRMTGGEGIPTFEFGDQSKESKSQKVKIPRLIVAAGFSLR